MLYSTLLILFGVYIGQEYPTLPSIRIVTIQLLSYINNYSTDKIYKDEPRSMENFLSNFVKSLYFTDEKLNKNKQT